VKRGKEEKERKEVLVKATHTFHPEKWTRRAHYVLLTCTVSVPANMPKELPAIDPTHTDTWVVVIGIRRWLKVAGVIREHRDDKIIVEGGPVCFNGQLMLLAQSVKSLFVEKQRQEAQRAASLAAVGS